MERKKASDFDLLIKNGRVVHRDNKYLGSHGRKTL